MNWLKKLFGRGGDDEEDYSVGIDFRSDEEIKIERDARKPLRGGNEATAQRLCNLARQSQKMGDAGFQDMQRIGQQLYAKGGHSLMQLVCYRVKTLGGAHSYVSTAWDGIGEWQD